MKVTGFDIMHCDAAWRSYSFLKITTDDGIIGWSEFSESWGFGGVSSIIQRLSQHVIGQDPMNIEAITSKLHAATRGSNGGVVHGGVGAIENALLDVKGKALGVPVYQLLGGAVRMRLPAYWTHCGTYRARHGETLGTPPLRSLDDIVKLGEEVRARGFKALKTNYMPFDGKRFASFSPGTGRTEGFPELNYNRSIIKGIQDQMAAFRQGGGPDMGLLIDLNFSFKPEGFIQIARALEEVGMTWIELDVYDPESLAIIRSRSPAPIASCEHLFGRRGYRPYFQNFSMDVAIIDVLWNGVAEGVKIASMAEAFEVNVAPHNYYGPLGDLMAAHFCATVPNFRIMEVDVDTISWQDEIVTRAPVVENGYFLLPDAPGWGADINEEVVRAHPARNATEYQRVRFAGG
jgi:L-alanine-DL-glutamate epimerase-like enolase superfamily enzyme